MRRRWQRRGRWELTALLNAADPQAPGPLRRLWLIRLAEWLRSPAPAGDGNAGPAGEAAPGTPWPLRRLRHLLNVLERHPPHAAAVRGVLQSVLRESDLTALLADFGFSPRAAFSSELAERLRLALLPGTPDTDDLGQLFQLIFKGREDAAWLAAVDAGTLERLGRLLVEPGLAAAWRTGLTDAIQLLASQVRAVGLSATLRQRMDPQALAGRPFHHLAQAATHLAEAAEQPDDGASLQAQGQTLRRLLQDCRQAADSVRSHLAAYGISVDLVFQVEQLRERTSRIERLLDTLVSPTPALALQQLLAELAAAVQARRGLRPLFAHHYSMLARKVAERSAETGEHYITRTRAEWLHMLRAACGGGLVIAGTTFGKFAIGAVAFSAFWAGFWAGVNYAASFVLIQLMHWTVATKQPAMTAPAMAARLRDGTPDDAQVEGFVDEVVHLIRSQFAGIVGNLAVVAPVVLAIQLAVWGLAGAPLVSAETGRHALEKLTLLGPTAAFAAFTGVLLFASSLIAGWVENWFVYHRLDSAIAWNPGFVRILGAPRAQRWSRWWRANISGLAANTSLGLMLGVVPVLAAFFGLPLEVRHVTLSTGQIAAAAGAMGLEVLREPLFWWALAAIPVTGALNLAVSFWLALRVALRSRGIRVHERDRIAAALRRRLRQAPLAFFRPPA
ncbi:MAG: site-specific recombinase [Burkholderiaceae bacterium]|nr:site-specific recombinase [Burkholderiaceae bacterium]